MKGLVVEQLVSEFGFEAISAEDIVWAYLPNKVANTVQSAGEIQELLKVTGTESIGR